MQQQNTTKMKDSDIIVREAIEDDLVDVLKLVEELAIYEKEPKAVTATLEEYVNLFKEGWFDCFVAVFDRKIIGIAIYYRTFSTWKGRMLHLEDLIVTESYRNEGIGQKLFETVLNKAKSMDCALLRWQVLDWNNPAIRFYEKNKAIIEKNWWNGKIIIDWAKYGLE